MMHFSRRALLAIVTVFSLMPHGAAGAAHLVPGSHGPQPATGALLLAGLGMMLFIRRRRDD